jgi:hypothetical protein
VFNNQLLIPIYFRIKTAQERNQHHPDEAISSFIDLANMSVEELLHLKSKIHDEQSVAIII